MPYSSGGRPGDRVEPDVGDLEVEEVPHVGAVGLVHDVGRDVAVLRGQVVLEHVGRLDDVVVDAHQDHVVDLHGGNATRWDAGCDRAWRRCARRRGA